MRILLVEDDPQLAADLSEALSAAGFLVDHATDGDDAWFRGEIEDYALAVLDLGLPQLDGLSVLKRWRAAGRSFPVLILTARSDWTEKVEGIEAGADDYLAKPFQMGELIARARALVRRAAGLTRPILTIAGLSLDTVRMAATVDGRPVRLSQLEFRLLDLLAHNIGRAVSNGEVAEHLYGGDDSSSANAVEAVVTRLRRKVGPDIIETRRGFGYSLGGGEG
ncbi:MAG: response regulator transcription factor [Proteobacteria bacterium]|nr:response regulator transcription factor [Pseudomonadota bacterium]